MSTDPVVDLVSLVENLNCAGGTDAIGEITIAVSESGAAPATHDIQWFSGAGAVGGNEIGGAITTTLTGLSAGAYSVRVRNTTSGCETIRDYNIQDLAG